METYVIDYDFTDLATLEIDEAKAAPFIKEMVDFWSGAKDRLKENGGSYLRTWLKQLGMFILSYRRPPQADDEGWYALDGTYGIHLTHWERWEPSEDEITINTHS